MLDLFRGTRPWHSDSGSSPLRKGPWTDLSSRTVLWTASAILCCILSFALGRYTVHATAKEPIPLSEYTYTFKHNRTFGERPSPESDAAWASIFPEDGGYLTHPDIAPTRSAVAVFHQLHCLNSLRKTLWTVFATAEAGTKMDVKALPPRMSVPHIRHCIDLIRQSMMCRPDLTIESYNFKLGGVTGFGTAHRCKDWGELYDFVSEWEFYDPGGLGSENLPHPHDLHE